MIHGFRFPPAVADVAAALQSFFSACEYYQSGFDVDVGGQRLVAPDQVGCSRETLRAAMDKSDGDARLLLSCFGTLHFDGYVREACLRELDGVDRDWVLPFVVNRLGDRVSIVALVAVDALEAREAASIHAFARSNPVFMARVRSRAASYWGEYYRYNPWPRSRNYPPIMVLDGIDKTLRAVRANVVKKRST